MTSRFAAVVLTLLVLPTAATAMRPPSLRSCAPASGFYCGTIVRALDPRGVIPGTIPVHFEWLPHSAPDTPSQGVIVANEGGPGSGSTETRTAYRALFAPLLHHRDLLLMDNRGTGKSRAIDCEPLQKELVMTSGSIALCGAHLGKTAALYGTRQAADDLAAILDVLHIRAVDMYGDSYGTFFSQTFAAHYPDRLRSLILDGAYPVLGGSPWYPEAPAAMRHAYDAVCRRATACSSIPGSSLSRIGRLLDDLRSHPAVGTAPIGAAMRRVSVAPSDLAFVMNATGLVVVPYRELDAAARAYVDGGDRLPLLRLVGESYAANETDEDAAAFSRGLFTAVSCADYTQAYDPRLTTAARRAQWRAAIADTRVHDPAMYAPFTLDEWVDQPPDYSALALCLQWPAPLSSYPPGQPVSPGTKFPAVPTLVISGELDTVTPAAQGAAAAALFPQSTHVVMANGAHVNAIEDPYDCASRIARRFVETLKVGDTSCAAALPEIRTVPAFVRHVNDLAPARPLAGNRADARELRAATAAVQTVGDALARTLWLSDQKRLGLRGGSFAIAEVDRGLELHLEGLRWTEDLALTGTVQSDKITGDVRASVTTRGISRGTLSIRWSGYARHAVADVRGTLDGESVRASLPAP